MCCPLGAPRNQGIPIYLIIIACSCISAVVKITGVLWSLIAILFFGEVPLHEHLQRLCPSWKGEAWTREILMLWEVVVNSWRVKRKVSWMAFVVLCDSSLFSMLLCAFHLFVEKDGKPARFVSYCFQTSRS